MRDVVFVRILLPLDREILALKWLSCLNMDVGELELPFCHDRVSSIDTDVFLQKLANF